MKKGCLIILIWWWNWKRSKGDVKSFSSLCSLIANIWKNPTWLKRTRATMSTNVEVERECWDPSGWTWASVVHLVVIDPGFIHQIFSSPCTCKAMPAWTDQRWYREWQGPSRQGAGQGHCQTRSWWGSDIINAVLDAFLHYIVPYEMILNWLLSPWPRLLSTYTSCGSLSATKWRHTSPKPPGKRSKPAPGNIGLYRKIASFGNAFIIAKHCKHWFSLAQLFANYVNNVA